MRTVNRLSIGVIILLTGLRASASIDCVRTVYRVWSGSDPNQVFVEYTDGFASAAMALAYVNNDQSVVNRTLSIILAGTLAGRTISFRYLEGVDGSPASCSPTVYQKLIGAWVYR
jgi:hypothetical protein